MGLPDISEACIELPSVDLSGFFALFPGGIQLSAFAGLKVSTGDTIEKFLAQMNTALMPLVPLFDLIDTLLIIKGIFDAVTSLNPYKIAEKVKLLLPKLDKLKSMLPPLAIPPLLRAIVAALIVFVSAFKAQLNAMIDVEARIGLAGARAELLGAADLAAAVSCTQLSLDVQFNAMIGGAAPLNRFIGLVNLLASIVGMPEIPTLGNFGASASSALAPVDILLDALQNLYDSIPSTIPDIGPPPRFI